MSGSIGFMYIVIFNQVNKANIATYKSILIKSLFILGVPRPEGRVPYPGLGVRNNTQQKVRRSGYTRGISPQEPGRMLQVLGNAIRKVQCRFTARCSDD